MQDNQRRRITFGIISLLVGLVVGNMAIQTALRESALELPVPAISMVGAAIGVALVALGVFLVIRYVQVRRQN